MFRTLMKTASSKPKSLIGCFNYNNVQIWKYILYQYMDIYLNNHKLAWFYK